MRLLEWLRQYDIPAIYALTKADKMNRGEAEKARQTISAGLDISGPLLLTSAKNGLGMKELWGEIIKSLKNL
jgi:GTP-binding protein EngB required for normal cell division